MDQLLQENEDLKEELQQLKIQMSEDRLTEDRFVLLQTETSAAKKMNELLQKQCNEATAQASLRKRNEHKFVQ